MIGYRRYVEPDDFYPSSFRTVSVPYSRPTNRRCAVIRCHGSGCVGSTEFGGRTMSGFVPDYRQVWFADRLLRACGNLVFINPDLGFNDGLTRSQSGCTTTSGSNRVACTGAADADQGKTISGAGIPAGTTIIAVTVGASFTISANATASAAVTLTVGPNPNNGNSWGNKNALLQLDSYFGTGGLLDRLGCRTDKAYFIGESQGGMPVIHFALNWPSRIAGITMLASAGDVEWGRSAQMATGVTDVNVAWARPLSEVGQVDMNGAATGHPTVIDPVTGIVTPAYYYGTSLKFPTGLPLAGQIAAAPHPLNIAILRARIAAGAVYHNYESTYDTVAGPNVTSSIPDPADPTHTNYLRGGARILTKAVGGDTYTYSTVDDHPGSSTNDPIHTGENVLLDLPVDRIANEILAVA